MLDVLIRTLERLRLLRFMVAPLRRLGLLTRAFHRYERYAARKTSVTNVLDTPLPLPPPELLYQVAGSADTSWFLVCGSAIFQAMQSVLARNNVSILQRRSVLDFGCGCGRVLRFFTDIPTPAQIHGLDYNGEMVAWCKNNLPFAYVSRNDLEPPVNYADETFDFIYAISVFTHLAENLQFQWMAELGRLLKPGGVLLFSTHGDSFLHALSQAERETFAHGDLVVHYDEASGSNLCNAYHPTAFVRARLANGFDVLEHVEAGEFPHVLQDVYLLRKA